MSIQEIADPGNCKNICMKKTTTHFGFTYESSCGCLFDWR